MVESQHISHDWLKAAVKQLMHGTTTKIKQLILTFLSISTLRLLQGWHARREKCPEEFI